MSDAIIAKDRKEKYNDGKAIVKMTIYSCWDDEALNMLKQFDTTGGDGRAIYDELYEDKYQEFAKENGFIALTVKSKPSDFKTKWKKLLEMYEGCTYKVELIDNSNVERLIGGTFDPNDIYDIEDYFVKHGYKEPRKFKQGFSVRKCYTTYVDIKVFAYDEEEAKEMALHSIEHMWGEEFKEKLLNNKSLDYSKGEDGISVVKTGSHLG